ncbi:MAG TPA: energy transducer TonB [Thermoanaerobaculia bacterium]|nr:energy transducer TonB [Thermoanaerobaculia bacterium]
MRQRKGVHTLIALSALLLLAGEAWSGVHVPTAVKIWQDRLDTAEEQLRAGEYKKAHDLADLLERQMLDAIEGGDGARPLLARALVIRSFANAGLGKMRDATWDWFMARAVYPEMTDESLATSGKVGEILAAEIAKLPGKPKPDGTPVEPRPTAGTVTPPKKLRGRSPAYPYALQKGCLEGTVQLRGIIDTEGRIHRPGVLESPSPLLTVAALEAFRTWRFQPARYEGKPVLVYYTLTIKFTNVDCFSARKLAG